MLKEETITRRLEDMALQQYDPSDSRWPENCEGSRKALVIFVGPGPGGKKEDKRRQIKLNHYKPLWSKPYNDPILEFSIGFRKSFQPIVEAIFKKPYSDAAKLIAIMNMDWLPNPESRDVQYRYMWEGCKCILPVLYECDPDLIIPMDEKSFGVLQIALYHDGYEIIPARIGKIKIKIPNKDGKAKYHNSIMAFRTKKEEKSFLVIKSLQHPARIFDVEYARRVGQSIRCAAEQIWNDVS